MEKYSRVRNLEKESRWEEAAKLWREMGYDEDADACQLIADAIEEGNKFRDEVKRTIGDEPELTPNSIRIWQLWHQELNTIYKRHFES